MIRAFVAGQVNAPSGYLGSDNYGLLALLLGFVGGVVFSIAIYLLVKSYEEGALHRGFHIRRG